MIALSEKTLVVLGFLIGFLAFLGLLGYLVAEPCKDCHVPPPPPPTSINITVPVTVPVMPCCQQTVMVVPEPKPVCQSEWIPEARLKVSFAYPRNDCRLAVCLDGRESGTRANECGGIPSGEQTRIVKWRFEVFKRGEVVSVSEGGDARVDSRYNFFLDTERKEELKFVLTVTASDEKTASDEWVGGEYREP